jgi:hypothetical protein
VYKGTPIGMQRQLAEKPIGFTLQIAGDTQPAVIQDYRNVLQAKGEVALLEAMSETNLGSFRLEGQPQRQINYVQVNPEQAGRMVTVLFARDRHVFGLHYGENLKEYPFSYLELFIGDSGKGEGTLVTAAKIHFSSDSAEGAYAESYDSFPARLTGVQVHEE